MSYRPDPHELRARARDLIDLISEASEYDVDRCAMSPREALCWSALRDMAQLLGWAISYIKDRP